MSFWINDRLGVAYESNEYGTLRWNPSEMEFNIPITSEFWMANRLFDDGRRVSEAEAEEYAIRMSSKDEPRE